MSVKSSENTAFALSAGDKLLTFERPQIMGIINLTPDSFYDGGRYGSLRSILQDVEEKIRQGVDILDLGAASTRPGALKIQEDEEWKRLEPALLEIRKQFPSILISIDTSNASIAKKSANQGANLINDISGGTFDSEMFTTVAQIQLPYILMHIQGNPQNMQVHPVYQSVINEVGMFFKEKIKELNTLGFDKIILDPGFGFGKTLEHNYQLLKHLSEFSKLKYPVLAGISRKSIINSVLGTSPVTALNGTTGLNTLAVLNGASILRVHDVQEAKQAIELIHYYKTV